ncbi:thiamine diphosphokinase [Mycoplasma sp. HU2014]|uniref:thiamine diphosphokinase n=1 Tax=Mycoplasma sp. HU2014 TaxID=1664275 RepID=UPI00067DDDB8|nr:thiamine diphosphokinase [Mycoplasma sp. HU2014]KNG79660.1 thiamine pyrophosphokinase [Mycoplasma sp. HU2014]
MNYKKILIVTSTTNIDLNSFNNVSTYVIGVERGCLHLIDKKIRIDLAIGDFDKVDDAELNVIKEYANKIEIWPSEKDFFDGEIAIIRAREISKEAKILFVANATRRYEKNFSIFSLIFKYDIKFINDYSIIFLLKKGENTLEFNRYQDMTYVSFISKDDTKITIKGLKYETTDLLLKPIASSCLSNAFIPYKDATITTDCDVVCIMSK